MECRASCAPRGEQMEDSQQVFPGHSPRDCNSVDRVHRVPERSGCRRWRSHSEAALNGQQPDKHGMNYFDYNANKGRPAAQPSKASYDVIDPPEYWVTEHGEMSDETWERLKLAAGQVA